MFVFVFVGLEDRCLNPLLHIHLLHRRAANQDVLVHLQRFSLTEPLTTPLVSVPNTVELATRICRILVIRLAKLAEPKAVYVGCSIMVDGFGDRVREEVDVLECVVGEVGRLVGRQQVR